MLTKPLVGFGNDDDGPDLTQVVGEATTVAREGRKLVVQRYGLAVLAFGVALALRLLLSPLMGNRPVIVLFVSAVLLVAILAGMGPAILVTGLVLTYDAALKIRSDNLQPADIINTLAFCLVVLEVHWVSEILRRVRSEADRSRSAEKEWRTLSKGLIDASPLPTLVVDPSGHVELLNEPAAAMFGYRPQEVALAGLGMLFGPAWRTPPDLGAWLGRHLVDGQHRNGSRVPFAAEVSAIWLEGRVVMVLNLSKEPEERGSEFDGQTLALDIAPRSRLEAPTIAERLASASPRERQVLEGLIQGKSNKEIGIKLGISPRTVERHRANLMRRMSASSLSDLVRMVLESAPVSVNSGVGGNLRQDAPVA